MQQEYAHEQRPAEARPASARVQRERQRKHGQHPGKWDEPDASGPDVIHHVAPYTDANVNEACENQDCARGAQVHGI
jgi:hypothetical protein